MTRAEPSTVVKTHVAKSVRDAFREKAAANGQSIASRLALLMREDVQRGKVK